MSRKRHVPNRHVYFVTDCPHDDAPFFGKQTRIDGEAPQPLVDDLWKYIFGFIDLEERLKLERVCRKWRRIMPYTKLYISLDMNDPQMHEANVRRFVTFLYRKRERYFLTVVWAKVSAKFDTQLLFLLAMLEQLVTADLRRLDLYCEAQQNANEAVVWPPGIAFPFCYLDVLHCHGWTPNVYPRDLREFSWQCSRKEYCTPFDFTQLFAACPRLETLTVRGSLALQELPYRCGIVGSLPVMRELKTFRCNAQQLPEHWLFFALDAMPNLETLELGMEKFNQSDQSDLKALPRLRKLEILTNAFLPQLRMSCCQKDFLDTLEAHNLESFTFQYARYMSLHQACIDIGTLFPRLKSLSIETHWFGLQYSELKSLDLVHIFDPLKNLQMVDISSFGLSNDAYLSLAFAPPSLRVIKIGGVMKGANYYSLIRVLRANNVPRRKLDLKIWVFDRCINLPKIDDSLFQQFGFSLRFQYIYDEYSLP